MMAKTGKISRRKFVVGGALGTLGVVSLGTILFRNPIRRKIYEQVGAMDNISYLGEGVEPMLWFEITENNLIKLYSPKVEMGQGTFTGMAQIAADELNFPVEDIQVEHAASASGNLDAFSTGGSTSIASLWQPLRELSATFRVMLQEQAAKQWGVPSGEIEMREGTAYHQDKTKTYAEIASVTKVWDVPDTPELKPVSDYAYVGKPIPRVDLKAKVFGDPIFGMDAEMPNMLFGTVLRPTQIGARLVSLDKSEILDMPGITSVVEEEEFTAIVGRSAHEVLRAKQQAKVNWEVDEEWTSARIKSMLEVGKGKEALIQKQGRDVETDNQTLELAFRTPIGAHAQLEPNAVVADYKENQITLKIATQVVALTRKEVAKATGIDEDDINVIPTFLGGGFGRRLHTPHAVHAVLMSKAVGKPVKYFFTRQEEFQHDMFRPPTHHILKAELNNEGGIEAVRHDFCSGDVAVDAALLPPVLNHILGADVGAMRGALCQYGAIENIRTVAWHVDLPFATSWWRSLGLLANTFAWESFMDELALKTKQNPLEFRIQHIQDDLAGQRLKAVIQKVGEISGYQDKVVDGVAYGFAASTDAGTPCAQVVKLSKEGNQIKVHKVFCVMDPGLSVNPDQVKAQCEGAIIMGLSASLFEKMEVEEGALTPTIYGPYQMTTLKTAPRDIEVVLLQGIDQPGPVGEPPLGPIGAALGNAIRRLTGERPTNMPFNLS
ncbi:MAG: molybdopterin cofactor-binding domain-containing protein [Bacteroidota bacterium]